MKANIRLLKKQRVFSEEFKKRLVEDYESGQFSVKQLGRLHHINPGIIYRWVHKYSTFNEKGSRIVEMSQSSSKKVKDLEAKIKELEQKVGQKQIMIDYLETMIDVAKDELDIDIKKNYDTLQSNAAVKNKGR